MTAGPLTAAGITAFHGVNHVRGLLGADSTAVAFGAGGLGSFAIQFLRVLTPARVIAFDITQDKREVALELGAHEALAGVDDTTLAAILGRTGERGADAILDFVGIDATINVGGVGPGGAFGVIAACGGTLTAAGGWYNLLPEGGRVFTYQGGSLSDAQSVIALACRGLVTSPVETFTVEQVEEAYDRLREGSLRGRAVVVFGG